MKRILALFASPYQLLALNRIIDQYYPDDKVYLAVADTISKAEYLVEKAKAEERFSDVFLWKIKGRFSFSKPVKIINYLQGERKSEVLTAGLPQIMEKWDMFLFANISQAVLHIGNVLLKNNPDIEINMFEDGFSTLSNYTGSFLNQGGLKGRMRGFFSNINALYLFNPELLDWKPSFEVRAVSKEFDENNKARLNRIFGYDELKDNYRKKLIFFEESYFADGMNIDDVEIVEKIAEVVGKENIMIKIHPRNPVNRFHKKGYHTNENTFIPWELIAMNEDFSDTVFVTMLSASVMNAYFLLGKEVKSYIVYKCSKTPEAFYAPILDLEVKCCRTRPDLFCIPEDFGELKDALCR